jgi:AraC-like DNA-binding protein
MPTLFMYRDSGLYAHHTLDHHPRDYAMHAHDVHELYCFLAGQGSYYVEGHEYPLSPGCILALRAGEAHCLHISPEQPYERLAIHFAPSLLDTIDADRALQRPFVQRPLGLSALYRPQTLRQDLVQAYLQPLLEARDQHSAGDQRLLVLTALLPMLYELSRCFHRLQDEAGTPQNIMVQVIAHLNAHLNETPTADELARRFYVSKTYLNRHFQHVTGSTVREYILTKRLMLARQRIRGGVPASQAAEACGWGDYSSFYRQYRARFGVSPAEDKRAAGTPR